ncbi:MAG TPA: hypothetical protein VNB49_15805 [Candidatus Dormibacteraeota bacterium]|nr:hypothetical protein [Candidatus Dormibacteraeota bacterium]
MRCDEFEAIGLDGGRDASLTEVQRNAAAAHAASCPRCAALRNSWEAARLELRALEQVTAAADAPARIEMRLRQQFRTQHHALRARRIAVAAGWGLAAAAVLVSAVSWVKWLSSRGRNPLIKPNAQVASDSSPRQNISADSENLVANNEMSDFTFLPGALPGDSDDAAILRVRMQRGALGALGLPVNEDRAGEWIQVDLLVGNDGLPQAVRLPE